MEKLSKEVKRAIRKRAAISIGWRFAIFALYVTLPLWMWPYAVIKSRVWEFFSLSSLREQLRGELLCDHDGNPFSAFRLLLFPCKPQPLPKAEFRVPPDIVVMEKMDDWQE
jgi:hypothetical protein